MNFYDNSIITEAALEFNDAMKADSFDSELRASLISEETGEVVEAYLDFEADPSVESASALIKEFADFLYVIGGSHHVREIMDAEVVAGAKLSMQRITSSVGLALTDFLVFEAVSRVHTSNMSKLDENGEPIFRDDGKVLKGPNYTPPRLDDLALCFLYRYMVLYGDEDQQNQASQLINP